jgi:chromosome segregation ATPase
VRTALGEVVRRKQAMVDTQRQIDDKKKQLAEVTAEQARIRENLKTVAQNTEYYTRLMKKLNEQETSIEQLQKESGDLQKTLETQRKELEGYVAGLNVG